MRKLVLLFITIFLITSCSTKKTIVLTNGKKISERKDNRMIKRSVKRCLRKFSKEDRSIIMEMVVDTSNVSGN